MHTILQRPIIEETPVSNSLNDFREIDGWTVEEHCQLHKQDLAWLNSIVNAISVDSERKIVIFTHYSPTEDIRAVEPCHAQSDIKSDFQTDLRNEDCWKNPNIKVWRSVIHTSTATLWMRRQGSDSTPTRRATGRNTLQASGKETWFMWIEAQT
ncbi:calcineurin-like phosphoesterase [Colletotrichum abscissum]|uniref:Calcineurin-like phosphoesterase n=1 Tax=Colletotrichum abscissum TaxID=1671311 RepID=A0A9P9X8E0_9PEZI|nr:calcineurin-like phosphoesterase [Colletotrichum abscissum]